jgi:hypothetical protein
MRGTAFCAWRIITKYTTIRFHHRRGFIFKRRTDVGEIFFVLFVG